MRHSVLLWAVTLLACLPQPALALPQAMQLLAMCLQVYQMPSPQQQQQQFSLPTTPRSPAAASPTPLTSPQHGGHLGSPSPSPSTPQHHQQHALQPPSPSHPPLPHDLEHHLLAVTHTALLVGGPPRLPADDGIWATPR